MKKVIFLIGFVLSVSMYGMEGFEQVDLQPQQVQHTQDKAVAKSDDSVFSTQGHSSNFSIKPSAFANEGFSEAELEMGNANLNEVEAPMSRYGVGVELGYSIKPNARVKLEFFTSNALELNMQRRGGKVKAYENGVRYEENAYDYGNKMMYSTWVSNIGLSLTVLNIHRLTLVFKQAQLSNSEALFMLNAHTPSGAVWVSNVATNSANISPYATNTQIFLTYSYVF